MKNKSKNRQQQSRKPRIEASGSGGSHTLATGCGAQVIVGGDMELTAIRSAKIAGSATITYTTKSGNCAPRLP